MLKMEEIMDIFALHRDGLSLRAIARRTGLHRETVKKYIEGQSLRLQQQANRKSSLLDGFKEVIRELLEQDNYQATWIYDRVKAMGYGGGYDMVKNFVRTIKEQKSKLAYMRFESQPGLQGQMDWADFPIDDGNGKSTKVYLFALVLGYSRAMYAECMERCTLESFMDGHIHAFHYLGGAPSEVLYDNMKHVVLERDGNQIRFNGEFLHFAHHYGYRPRACPPYSPWVKGKVERPIRYVEERFWRGYRFESLSKANADLAEWLKETANQRIHGSHGEPVLERWEREKPSLSPLPAGDWDTSVKVYRKVYKDCLLSYGGNRYAVPHRAVGKRVLLKIKGKMLQIFDDGEFLVRYQLYEGNGRCIGMEPVYKALQEDAELAARKYGCKKGRASRGLAMGTLYPEVAKRDLSEYEALSGGGVQWIN